MLSRSFQELELISTSDELLAAQCHFITFLMHTLAKITVSVKKKRHHYVQRFRQKKSRAVILLFINLSKKFQTFLNVLRT